MPQTVNINGVAISYPVIGDTEWGVEATKFAELVGVVLQKIGQGNQSTTNNIVIGSISSPGNLTVASGDLSVSGNTALTGNLTANGNTTLGNANTDTIAVTGILNVDSGTLYVNPTDNRVGINDSTPSEALDVVGNALVSGSITGTSATLTDLTVDTNLIKTDSANDRVGINTTSPTVALDVTGNIKASSQIQIPDGTVSVPSISPSSETTSGLYKIATNKLGIAINGSRVGEFGVGYGGFTGNIIQVQSTTLTSSFSSTPSAGNYSDITGLSVSITPKYNTSKILIIANISGSSANQFFLRFDCNGTPIGIGDSSSSELRVSMGDLFQDSDTYGPKNTSMNFLHSPASTSTQTYKIQGTAGGVVYYINRSTGSGGTNAYGRSISTITVMELQQ